MSRNQTLSRRRRGQGRKPLRSVEATKTGPYLDEKKRNIALSILLAGVTIALYGPVAGHRIVVWDDYDFVTELTNFEASLRELRQRRGSPMQQADS
jgi:hypothetical protein